MIEYIKLLSFRLEEGERDCIMEGCRKRNTIRELWPEKFKKTKQESCEHSVKMELVLSAAMGNCAGIRNISPLQKPVMSKRMYRVLNEFCQNYINGNLIIFLIIYYEKREHI